MAQHPARLEPDDLAGTSDQAGQVDEVVQVAADATDDEQGRRGRSFRTRMDHGRRVPVAIGINLGRLRHLPCLDQPRKVLDGRTGKQRRDRKIHAELVLDAAEQPHRQQRMPAEVEEPLVRADRLDPQDLAPDRRKRRLDRGQRPPDRGGRTGAAQLVEQGRPVQLAVRRDRQGGQAQKLRRHHVPGQVAPQHIGNLGRGRRSIADIGGQKCPALIGRMHHRRPLDARHFGQRRLDLAGFDPEAAHLHLAVAPPEVFQHPVLAPAADVAGAIDPRFAQRGCGAEGGGGQIVAAEIPQRQTVARDHQFAGHADRQRRERRIHHMGPRVAHRNPDRHVPGLGRQIVRDGPGAGERRVLGRAVTVDQAHPRQGGKRPADMRNTQRLAAGQNLVDASQNARITVHQCVEQAGCQPQGGNAVLRDGRAQRLRIGRRPGCRQNQRRPVQQRAPEFEGRGIEGDV